MTLRRRQGLLLAFLLASGALGCAETTQSLEVTATAYTSTAGETDAEPALAAWGDTLQPGMKAIAVSRDLIELGLDHGTEVTIEGLEGRYRVLDKMHRRWLRKIDIYMGEDKARALKWGKRQVRIHWRKQPAD
ncbi:3D domain-containing protein [Motiliproteus sp. SC1-56]|uniref:3D domain-containing protein n=1 Tax=Motiliproteus sp. SC1-56 TaxID=2799565 RepID=UPI001A8FA07F|nr:3D domain-containing protein [Motiliproteus sp. SC1-56]